MCGFFFFLFSDFFFSHYFIMSTIYGISMFCNWDLGDLGSKSGVPGKYFRLPAALSVT